MPMLATVAWLKDFNLRFEAEVRRLAAVEPFWRPCQRCGDGACCSERTFAASALARQPFQVEDWWLMLEYVRDHFSPADRQQLAANILSRRPACIFLFGKRCSVYPARNFFCRLHPYTVSYHPTDLFPVGRLALPSCQGYAPTFHLEVGELCLQEPKPVARDGRLVQLKLRKVRPLWLVDASDYVMEYAAHATTVTKSEDEWRAFLNLAGEAAGKECPVLLPYLRQIFYARPNSLSA